MKKIIQTVLCVMMLMPGIVLGQTVFSDVQITDSLQVGGYSIMSNGGGLSIGNLNSYAYNSSIYSVGDGNDFESNSRCVSIGFANHLNGSLNSHVIGNINYSNNSEYFMVSGFDNSVTGASGGSIIGSNNNISGTSSSFAVGFNNNISGGESIYQFGGGLTSGAGGLVNSLVVAGFFNTDLGYAISGEDGMSCDDNPLFIIGNGYSPYQTSNALLMQKSGRTTLSNRNYVAPSTDNPNPTQPEVLVLNGTAIINGQINMSQRQGDIWMGSFGRTEDQGPTN